MVGQSGQSRASSAGTGEGRGDDPLRGILQQLSDLAQQNDTTRLGDFIAALEARGFGPLLLVLSALMMLPVGMLPGFPAVIGLLILLCAVQMLRGSKGIWLPGRLKRVEIPSDRLQSSLRRAWPVVRRLRGVLGERLTKLLNSRAALLPLTLLVALAGLAMIGLGFVPGLPFLLALPVLAFGLGLTAGDGAVLVLGYLLCLPALWVGIGYFL